MKSRGIVFSTFATLSSGALPMRHAIRRVCGPLDRGHHGVRAFEREFDRAHAQRVSLLLIGRGRDVPRGALQVVGDRPMELVAERLA